MQSHARRPDAHVFAIARDALLKLAEQKVGVRGYPTIKHGDPNDLQDYEGQLWNIVAQEVAAH